MLRQIEWEAQNEHITKNGVLPPATSIFSEFYLSIRTSFK